MGTDGARPPHRQADVQRLERVAVQAVPPGGGQQHVDRRQQRDEPRRERRPAPAGPPVRGGGRGGGGGPMGRLAPSLARVERSARAKEVSAGGSREEHWPP